MLLKAWRWHLLLPEAGRHCGSLKFSSSFIKARCALSSPTILSSSPEPVTWHHPLSSVISGQIPQKNSSSLNVEEEPNELVIHLHELRASAGKEITLFMSWQILFPLWLVCAGEKGIWKIFSAMPLNGKVRYKKHNPKAFWCKETNSFKRCWSNCQAFIMVQYLLAAMHCGNKVSKYLKLSCRSYQTGYVFTLQSSNTSRRMTLKDAFAVHCGLNPDLTIAMWSFVFCMTLSNWVKNRNFKGPIFAILTLTVAVRKIWWEQIVSFKMHYRISFLWSGLSIVSLMGLVICAQTNSTWRSEVQSSVAQKLKIPSSSSKEKKVNHSLRWQLKSLRSPIGPLVVLKASRPRNKRF